MLIKSLLLKIKKIVILKFYNYLKKKFIFNKSTSFHV